MEPEMISIQKKNMKNSWKK